MYHYKMFYPYSEAMVRKAEKWASENLSVKWSWCLRVIAGKVKIIIEWYE